MPEPSIRLAGSADAEILAALGAQTFTETFAHLYPPADLQRFLDTAYGLGRIQADLADPSSATWLAEADGQAVGYALAGACALPHGEVTVECGELKRIYLRRGWQNGGLGHRLLGAALDWLQRAGPRDVWIGVWSENHAAQRFYARHGFEKAGEYDFRVGDTVDHEYIMLRPAESFSKATPRAAGGFPSVS